MVKPVAPITKPSKRWVEDIEKMAKLSEKTDGTCFDMMEEGERKTAIDRFGDYCDQRAMVFDVNQPMQIVVKQGDQYRKRGLIGNERLAVRNAYIGKKGGVIVIFSQGASSGSIEMPIEDALKGLNGFGEFFDAWSVEYAAEDDTDMLAARKSAPRKVAEVSVAMMEDSRFGSW